MAELLFQMSGVDLLVDRIKLKADRIADMKPPMTRIYALLKEKQAENYDSSGGGNWQALSEAWALEKNRIGADPRILYMGKDRYGKVSEGLHDSIMNESHPKHVGTITSHGVQLGTNVSYAVNHQKGLGNNPSRPPLVFPAGATVEIISILGAWVNKGE